MLTQADLDRLLAAMRATGTTELEVASGAEQLRLVLPQGIPPAVPPVVPPVSARSPAIGHWLARGANDGLPPLRPGDAVRKGEVLGYVQAGPLRWILAAPEAGEVQGAGPPDGSLVGHGDPIIPMRSQP
jgi:acetyl-CoA carboxylase biotin carboxyl carrier protein